MSIRWRSTGASLALVTLIGAVAVVVTVVAGRPGASTLAAGPQPRLAASSAATGSVVATTLPSQDATHETTPVVPPTITVAAVGDMTFDSAPKRLIRASGPTAPLSAVASRLRVADVTLGNLECPLSTRGQALTNKQFTFRGDPRGVNGLVLAGFDLVSLANNHVRDYGGTALADTFSTLRRAHIAWAGAGADRASAWKPTIIVRRGVRIAYLAFSEIGPNSFAAGTHQSGTAFVTSSAGVKAAIKAAHKKADYVIVSFHWGVERSYTPTARQVSDGHAAIAAGADLVLSHHPHVLQGVEFYRGKLIAYSLGNFVFSPGSASGRDSMILYATLSPKGVSAVRAEPVYIGDNGRPTPQIGSTARRILRIVTTTSRARGTHVRVSGVIAHLAAR